MLTEERVRTVVHEHPRLLRRLRRMPGANTMLPVTRLPDTALGETIVDVVLPAIPEKMQAVMRQIEEMNADYERILKIYLTAMKHGEEIELSHIGPREEIAAVMACRGDIETQWPRMGKLGLALEQARRAGAG